MIVLEEFDTEFGHIKITRSRFEGYITYYQETCLHSQATSDGTSTCAYVHVMYSIIRQSSARDVLLIGCAGGTLATMLRRLGCRITVVDINPVAFAVATKYFKMPDDIECIVDDGLSFLRSTPNRYDAIALDAFNSDGSIPDIFLTEECFRVIKRVLVSDGIAIMNVMIEDDSDLAADRIALSFEAAEMNVVLFDWPGQYGRNTIVAGGHIDGIYVSSHRKPHVVRSDVRRITRRQPNRRAHSY